MSRASSLLTIEALVKTYSRSSGLFGKTDPVRALDGVDMSINRGEALGLVGESGSGKTTLARCVIRLVKATSGRVIFDGVDVLKADSLTLRTLRQRMQIVFQDPFGSLNPRMTVGAAVREPIEAHKIAEKQEARDRVESLFEEVGLDPTYTSSYPHQLSGGQRQRIGIARALSVEPEFVVLDEPVSALDVSVQAQVLNLLSDLRANRGLTYLFIAHDLAVVRHIADRVAVMYSGRLMEVAFVTDTYDEPLHPYTTSLLSAVPVPDPRVRRERIILTGDASARRPTSGCVFEPRCPHPKKNELCRMEIPPLREIRTARLVACHHAE